MRKFGIFVLLMAVSASWLGLSAQSDGYKYLDKQLRLFETRNKTKPANVSRGLRNLYKKIYDLGKVKLPFNSFKSIYPGHDLILLHKNDYIGAMATPIAMVSSDGDCIAYIQVLSQFADGWLDNDISDVKELVAVEVLCNKNDINSWQVDITEEDINRIFDENIKVYENDAFTTQCIADALLLCHFPCREKICVLQGGTYCSIHEEYPHFYTLIIYKDKYRPIKMHLFVTEKGLDKIDDYLSDICGSLRF